VGGVWDEGRGLGMRDAGIGQKERVLIRRQGIFVGFLVRFFVGSFVWGGFSTD